MNQSIRYTTDHPADFSALLHVYEALNWYSLGFTVGELERMCKGSWFAVYAYDGETLVGMGRVISEGVITGVICGLCVLPGYQTKGIGREMLDMLVAHCKTHRVIPQLMCVEQLVPYYEKLGFVPFTVGMKKAINR